MTPAEAAPRDLEIRTLRVGPMDNCAYVLASRERRQAVLIDAADEPERIAAALEGLELLGILETHCHPDHWQALAGLRRRFPSAWAGCHPADRAGFGRPAPERDLGDGEVVPFGAQELRVIATPGHTPGSLCFHLPGYVFTGDTLFPGGPGATVPPLGDFRTIMTSIEERLLSLPQETVVCPGHGEPTTIAAEAPQIRAWRDRGW